MPAFNTDHWPKVAGWIERANVDPLRVRIVERMFCDVGIGERPKGSNRSGRIDTYLRRAKVPESVIRSGKGYWCAAWLGAVWVDAGAIMWPNYADCDTWVSWGIKHKTWTPVEHVFGTYNGKTGLWTGGYTREAQWMGLIGSAVLFGIPGDASHIGGVIRADTDYRLTIEGNTTMNGYSRNGTLCDLKNLDESKPRVLGFVSPLLKAA